MAGRLTAGVFAFLTVYLWLSERAAFRRTGFVELWLDVKEYMATTLLYQTNMQERIKDLTVTPSQPQFSKLLQLLWLLANLLRAII